MNYNFEKIGERLKKERKAAELSQSGLSAKLFDRHGVISRQEIGRWESGKKIPSMEILLTLCNLFQCDLGYLLCEYDCKTREKTDIAEMTGLSEKAIDTLISSSIENQDKISTLDVLLCSDSFVNDFLDSVFMYGYFIYKYHVSIIDTYDEDTETFSWKESEDPIFDSPDFQPLYFNETMIRSEELNMNKATSKIANHMMKVAIKKFQNDYLED